ncbi:hypothetical protein QQS21_006789 [Conoideocrella luteorostrata]|uniref:Aminoglycoside phosphotransferase domain-containing protein n=1 Tax=Conoideocrella luteorostrata TaxID=1105319 RepID=A0AAJ0FXN9_9HYPO|nr:hypothetical protein QQS21_006789 [Conoideocrella luteorostrata]
MRTQQPSHALGSDAWLGADEYEPGSELHTRATNFFTVVNWDALSSIASQHRGGESCYFTKNFSVGHFNMTRRIVFEDGTSWVARLRFPNHDTAADREALENSKVMEIEVASMKSKTQIPVPKVHAYSFAVENDVGAAFILMDYIHGSVAAEFREAQGSAVGLFGTVEQDRKFREQMAHIQAIIASFRFKQIGSLYYNQETDDFHVGPELQTGKGPWVSSMEYYDDLTHHLLKSAIKNNLQGDQSFMVPSILNYLLRICGEEKTGPFRLVNRDFGAHNLLVNQDFDIVGVIDFDGVMAAPLEVVAQYPVLSFLQLEAPGIVDPRPAVVERVAQTAPRLQMYKDMLARYEEDDKSDGIRVAARLASESARVYQGMTAYQQHQDFVNQKWMKSCLKMLQDSVQDGVQSRMQQL